jgi:uncharacterized protein
MKFPAQWVVGRPWPFIAFFFVVTGFFALQLPNLEIDPEVKNQLPPNMEGRLEIQRIEDVFGGSEMLMVVLTADDVLAPETLRRLQKISEGLSEVKSVDRVIGLFTLTDIQGEDGMMLVEEAVGEIPETPSERKALEERLRRNDLVFGNVLAEDFTAVATIALLSTSSTDSESLTAVEAVLEANPGPEAIAIGGMPDVRTRVSEDIRSDMQTFVPIGLTIILVFLYVCFRQIRGVLLPFMVVVMSTIVAMGTIPLLGWKVQMVTVILPVILLAVANDYGIHLMAKYQEENVPGRDRSKEAIARRVLEDLGGPVVAAGLTTMAGLLCLTTHIIVPAKQLGVLASIGVGFALLASICFIPALLAVLPVAEPVGSLAGDTEPTRLERLLQWISDAVIARPKALIAGLLVAAVVATSGIAFLRVDTNPVNYYDAGADVAKTARLINAHFGGSTELSILVGGDLQEPEMLERIDALETVLGELPQVGHTQSVVQVVKKMNQAVMGGTPDAFALPESRAAVAQYFLLYSMGGDPEDFSRMVDFEYEHALIVARINSLGTQDIAEVVKAAEAHLRDNPPPGEVVVGGFGALFVDLVDAVVKGQLVSLSLSVVLVFILVGIAFRSVAAGLWAVVPLGIAIPVLFGLMGYLSIELNIVTAMLSSIMIGVGIDYTIHFLWRFREERRAGHDPHHALFRTLTTTGRGIVFNALSVVAGFAVLLISNFLPVKFFGFLVVVCISACLVGALVLLPAICLVVKPRFLEP